jgi:phage terminase small subunit
VAAIQTLGLPILLKVFSAMQTDQQVLKMQVALNYSAQKVAMENLRGDLSKAADLEAADLEAAVDQQVQIRSRDPSHLVR